MLSTLTPLWVPRVQSHPTKESSPPQAVTPPPPPLSGFVPVPMDVPAATVAPLTQWTGEDFVPGVTQGSRVGDVVGTATLWAGDRVTPELGVLGGALWPFGLLQCGEGNLSPPACTPACTLAPAQFPRGGWGVPPPQSWVLSSRC